MSSQIKFLAVGRLVKEDGVFAAGKHKVLCSQLADHNDGLVKSYKTHVQQIMDKGAAKLTPDKRIRLTSDGNDYDLHVMLSNYPGGDMPLVFFVFADAAFSKNASVQQMLNEFRDDYFAANDESDVEKAKEKSPNKATKDLLDRLLAKYSASKLQEVSGKVEAVKGIMQANVKQALENVEDLEQMENKAELLEGQGKEFQKSATKVRKRMQCDYYKVTALLVLIVVIIIVIVVASVVPKKK